MSGSATVAPKVLRLYRDVLRCHRERLPGPLQEMGNSYARDEFRRHRDGKTTKAQWQTFTLEWNRYLEMLTGKGDLPGGSGDIPDEALLSMNEEQQQRLQELKREAELARAKLFNPDI